MHLRAHRLRDPGSASQREQEFSWPANMGQCPRPPIGEADGGMSCPASTPTRRVTRGVPMEGRSSAVNRADHPAPRGPQRADRKNNTQNIKSEQRRKLVSPPTRGRPPRTVADSNSPLPWQPRSRGGAAASFVSGRMSEGSMLHPCPRRAEVASKWTHSACFLREHRHHLGPMFVRLCIHSCRAFRPGPTRGGRRGARPHRLSNAGAGRIES